MYNLRRSTHFICCSKWLMDCQFRRTVSSQAIATGKPRLRNHFPARYIFRMPDSPILDPSALEALRSISPEGDNSFLKELIDIYLTDTPKQLAALEEALAKQEAATVIRSSHSIKGSSGNFGATRLAKIAQEIESHGKANNLPAAAALLGEFKSQYALVAAALGQLAKGT